MYLSYSFYSWKIKTGRGLAREQKYLAERGYVVLHTDYRNHAESDNDPDNDFNLRLGYTEDVINAALALKNSEFTFVDKERIGLLGRSMGGGVAFNSMVVKPGVFDAYVAFAPVSANVVDNYNRWTRMNFEIVEILGGLAGFEVYRRYVNKA